MLIKKQLKAKAKAFRPQTANGSSAPAAVPVIVIDDDPLQTETDSVMILCQICDPGGHGAKECPALLT